MDEDDLLHHSGALPVVGMWRQLDWTEVARYDHPLAATHRHHLLLLLLVLLLLLLLLLLPQMAAADHSAKTAAALVAVAGWMDLLGLFDLGNLAHDLLELSRALCLLLGQLGNSVLELSRIIGRHFDLCTVRPRVETNQSLVVNPFPIF